MKTILWAMGALLTAAAVISCGTDTPASRTVQTTNTDTVPNSNSTGVNAVHIAFVNGDTLNANYDFLVDAQEELESEQQRMQDRIARKIKNAENRYRELQQKAATMTQTDMQQAQLELQNLDLEIQKFQEKLGTDYRKREAELQMEYLDRVDSFLYDFNKDGRYDLILNYQRGGNVLLIKEAYDITNDVLKGLNERYAEGLAAQRQDDADKASETK